MIKQMRKNLENLVGKDNLLNKDVKDIARDVSAYIKSNGGKIGKFFAYALPIAGMIFANSCTLRSPTMPTNKTITSNATMFANTGTNYTLSSPDSGTIEYKRPCDGSYTASATVPMTDGCYGTLETKVGGAQGSDLTIYMGENDTDYSLEQAILSLGVNPTTTVVNGIRGYIINPNDAQDGVHGEQNFDVVLVYWDGFGERQCNIDVQGSNSEIFNAIRKQKVHDSLHGYAYFEKVMKSDDLRVQIENLKNNGWDQP